MKKDHLLIIGVMTGNSLDAADVVLTAFHDTGQIIDLAFFSLPIPSWLFSAMQHLRREVTLANGDMNHVDKNFEYHHENKIFNFNLLLQEYMFFIAHAIHELIAHAKTLSISKKYDLSHIDLIGFHGQTCTHFPPSIAKNMMLNQVYTVQIGDGQLLADLTGITTVYDFRSDDLMNGGEGAPLAPFHNKHLALSNKNIIPITFINGGNTSNLAHITFDQDHNIKVIGWDAGPFNHFPDNLMRIEKGLPCDQDGLIGKTGKINTHLLSELFDTAAIDEQNQNFLMSLPPKSSDPTWYHIIPMLLDHTIPFADRLRTAEYFSAYLLFHSLIFTPPSLQMPSRFAVFGGGWRNPIIFNDFKMLLMGHFNETLILSKHIACFKQIYKRLQQLGEPSLQWSNDYGFDGQAMEARTFADLARCRILNIPFTSTETTGTSKPTVCGLICYPNNAINNTTLNLKAHLNSTIMLESNQNNTKRRWSRASAGWQHE